MLRICFVCQSGELEDKAILLAASLRRTAPGDTELVACYPERHGALRKDTEAAFAQLNVRVEPIRNPLRESYLIGHKLAALSVLDGASQGIFLDTDILAMAPLDVLPDGLAAVPATRHHANEATWRKLYSEFDLPFPASAPATLKTNERIAPYFNSGVIALPGREAAAFASVWIETAQRIDADPAISDAVKNPWLDQIALPIAAARCGLTIDVLEPRWNFPSWIWTIETAPIFFHYRTFKRLWREKTARQTALVAAASFPPTQKALRQSSWLGKLLRR